MNKILNIVLGVCIIGHSLAVYSDNFNNRKCADQLSKDTDGLQRSIILKINTELNRLDANERVSSRLIALLQEIHSANDEFTKVKKDIYSLFVNIPYGKITAKEMESLREHLLGEAAVKMEATEPPFNANLTFANHGGLLNDNSTWFGTDAEFRKIVIDMAAQNKVLVFISEPSTSMAAFTDVNVYGAKINVAKFLSDYYEQFYGGYSLAADKEAFLKRLLTGP